jgi:mono/diheme cytochrome c family protein
MKPLFSVHSTLLVALIGAFALMANAGGPLCWNDQPGGRGRPPHTGEGSRSDAAEGGSATQERERLLAMGRELFFERCGSCHDADGSKPMADGPPLNQRKVPEEKVSRVVDSRFKRATEEQRRAVKLHINTFMKR